MLPQQDSSDLKKEKNLQVKSSQAKPLSKRGRGRPKKVVTKPVVAKTINSQSSNKSEVESNQPANEDLEPL